MTHTLTTPKQSGGCMNLLSRIYDHSGKYMATITTERLHWLWNRYSHNNLPHLTNILQPPPWDFETKILWLVQRYITILLKKKPKIIQPNNNHYTLHPKITKFLVKSFKITHSYYPSPLTCPIQIMQYDSPHNWNIIFGSVGHAKSSRWKGIGLAHPTEHDTTLEAIHWARMAAKEDKHAITILIVNHIDWTTQQIPIATNTYIHILARSLTLYTTTPHQKGQNTINAWRHPLHQ